MEGVRCEWVTERVCAKRMKTAVWALPPCSSDWSVASFKGMCVSITYLYLLAFEFFKL